MTRKQFDEAIRSVNRRCRGHYCLTPEEMKEYEQEWQEALWAADYAKASLVADKIALRVGVHLAPGPKPWDVLQKIVLNLTYRLKEDCGYDVNDLILSNPLDGESHTVNCPQCGTEIVYYAPMFTPE